MRIVIAVIALLLSWRVARAEPPAKIAVFAVACYDVGKQALDGLPGVRTVTTGRRGGYEVDEVQFDPALTNIAKLEAALKSARTYLKTLDSR